MSAGTQLQRWLVEQGFHGDVELEQTGERFSEFLELFRPGQDAPTPSTFAVSTTGPVVLRDLPFYSLCAHHLLPFFGTADVLYLPTQRVIGLGGVPGLLQHAARQPQLQERLGEQLATSLSELLQPQAVLVRLRARQMCMEMRGAESTGLVETFAQRGEAKELYKFL